MPDKLVTVTEKLEDAAKLIKLSIEDTAGQEASSADSHVLG